MNFLYSIKVPIFNFCTKLYSILTVNFTVFEDPTLSLNLKPIFQTTLSNLSTILTLNLTLIILIHEIILSKIVDLPLILFNLRAYHYYFDYFYQSIVLNSKLKSNIFYLSSSVPN